MYPWLHYDITLDAAFYHVCMSASLTDRGPLLKSLKRDPAFNSKGFTYWKDGTTAFKKHQTSDCHRGEKAASRMFVMILQNIRFLADRVCH